MLANTLNINEKKRDTKFVFSGNTREQEAMTELIKESLSLT